MMFLKIEKKHKKTAISYSGDSRLIYFIKPHPRKRGCYVFSSFNSVVRIYPLFPVRHLRRQLPCHIFDCGDAFH